MEILRVELCDKTARSRECNPEGEAISQPFIELISEQDRSVVINGALHRDDLDSELRELRCVLCTETGVKDDCQKLVILVCAVDNSLEILFQYTNSLPVRILEDQSILDAVSGKINDMWFNVFNLLFQLMNLATLQSIQTVFLAIPGFIDGSVDLVQFTSDVKLIPIGKTRTDEK